MTSKGVALVTGSSQGIGRAVALRLADDGYDMAINDVPRSKENLDSLKQEIEAKGRKVFIFEGDVSVEGDVVAMVSGAVKHLGSLDVMVANAGILVAKKVVETSVEEWDRVLSVNARGVFLCYKYAGQQMINQGRGGRIIGASSVCGKQGEILLGAYSASKFAVRGLTQTTAKELGPYGITVNAYAPGTIATPLVMSYFDDAGGTFEAEKKLTVLGYIGEPNDIGSIVSYLVSKEAHFITGQSISVNGGRYFD
ncbi:acetoin reductase family protein [Collybia nuda]|uniref:Acetoin reductase family protein n=1 Tax=Collybia nuda TaxID=64659 RepID=A0A9P5Y1Y3_9AGAR|nr:acetoin reductase family protein [Collybia nuda]